MIYRHATGFIEVICGPMFSDKSEELIRRLRRAQLARQRVQVFKPALDERYAEDRIVPHSEMALGAVVVRSSEELAAAVLDQTEVVGVDEVQFFDPGIVAVFEKLANTGRRVIVAGLDLDYLGRPFEPVPHFMAVAEYVTKTLAVCARCGGPASRSQRLVASNERIVVGATSDRVPGHQQHHRRLQSPLPHCLQHLDAVLSRQHPVQDHHVERRLGQRLQGILARRRRPDLEALGPQPLGKVLRGGRIVFHHQDLHRVQCPVGPRTGVSPQALTGGQGRREWPRIVGSRCRLRRHRLVSPICRAARLTIAQLSLGAPDASFERLASRRNRSLIRSNPPASNRRFWRAMVPARRLVIPGPMMSIGVGMGLRLLRVQGIRPDSAGLSRLPGPEGLSVGVSRQ